MEQVTLGPQDRSEVLRYLEYRGQELPAELTDQVDYCMDQVNRAADPRCLMKIFSRKDRDDYPPRISGVIWTAVKRLSAWRLRWEAGSTVCSERRRSEIWRMPSSWIPALLP